MTGQPRYTVLAGDTEHEIEVKRSRFLCYLSRVDSEAAAREYIDLIRAEHRLARHHCTAFLLGPRREVQRSNDDGEPSGTAGAPMLDALSKFSPVGDDRADLSDIVAVVVRYFGGVLLGAGGLVRAYSDAVAAALAQAEFRIRARQATFALDAPIAEAGRWENELRAAGIEVLGTDYATAATIRLAVPDTQAARAELDARIAAVTTGRATAVPGATEWIDLSRR